MNVKWDEEELLNLLRQHDERAFSYLVEQYHTPLVRLARLFVQDSATAEELCQETWLSVLLGLDHFERRSSLKTWIYTILINKAKTRSRRDSRLEVFSDLPELDPETPTVAPERFNDTSAGKRAGHWSADSAPVSWSRIPEETFLSKETLDLIRQTIEKLPKNQQITITLRDLDGLSSEEARNVLGISETNQRVLLHRARAKVRQALEDYFQPEH